MINSLVTLIKKHLPRPIKKFLTPAYHAYKKARYSMSPPSYDEQLLTEVSRFEQEEEVNDLPAIFHYWSNKYLVPKLKPYGFSNPDEFFLKYAVKCSENKTDKVQILSIGSGNCDTEVRLAQKLKNLEIYNVQITCLDINSTMLKRGKKLALEHEVIPYFLFEQSDFNQWTPSQKYNLVIANQCLHHVIELEHLYDQINSALTPDGYFITSDTIGKNGHMRWPEALKLLQQIWGNMPDRYKTNHAMQRFEKKYINHDCSTEGFEGIRAQDVLPLLVERFNFELFISFANLILIFIDRSFGPNFDPNNPEDVAFIDQIHQLDEKHMKEGTIKPTQMLAVMRKQSLNKYTQASSNLAASDAIRKP